MVMVSNLLDGEVCATQENYVLYRQRYIDPIEYPMGVIEESYKVT